MNVGVTFEGTYDEIKHQIIVSLSDSDIQKFKRLLADQQLGKHKPSAALPDLQRLEPQHPDIVQMRFIEIMPEGVCLILTTLSEVNILTLANTAGTLLEQIPNNSSISSIAPPKHSGTVSDTIAKLVDSQRTIIDHISELTKKINAIGNDSRG